MAESQAAKTARLEANVAHLTNEVSEMRGEIKGLVDAWTTATGIVSFVKWTSVIAGALGVMWATFKAKVFASLG
jgi:hypothetical protein